MALFKSEDQREIEVLERIRRRIRRRERLHHILIAGLAVLSVAAFIGGHECGRHCKHHL